MDWLMGQCMLLGWSERQFWYSSYRAVFNLLRAKQAQDEQSYKISWEQTRFICDYVIAPYRKKGSKKRSIDFPWDHDHVPMQPRKATAEELAKFAKWDARVKKKFNATQ